MPRFKLTLVSKGFTDLNVLCICTDIFIAYIQTFIHVVAVKGILKLLAYINDRIIVSIPAQFWPVMIFLSQKVHVMLIATFDHHWPLSPMKPYHIIEEQGRYLITSRYS